MTKFYFAITEPESKKEYLDYPVSKTYTHKGVHLSLISLQRFIKQEFPLTYQDFNYVELTDHDLKVDTNVINVDKNIVAVQLPIKVVLKNKHIKPLFKTTDIAKHW